MGLDDLIAQNETADKWKTFKVAKSDKEAAIQGEITAIQLLEADEQYIALASQEEKDLVNSEKAALGV